MGPIQYSQPLQEAVVVQSLSHVRLFVTPRTAGRQVSLSFTIFQSLLKLMSIESMMLSNHLILHCLILLQSFPASGSFPMNRLFASGVPSFGSFSFNISTSNEYSGLISFRMDWFDLLGVQGTLKNLLQHHNWKINIYLYTMSSLSVYPLMDT